MKKKIFGLFLCVAMMLTFAPSCFADSTTIVSDDGNWEYLLPTKNVTEGRIVKYLGNDTDIAIPSKIGDYEIIEMPYDDCFDDVSKITSLYIPDTITSLPTTDDGGLGLQNYTGLKSVRLSNSINQIYIDVFKGCKSLESIDIPSNVNLIWEGAFKDCTALKSITIRNNNIKINKGAFEGCSNVKTLTVPFIGQTKSTKNYLSHMFGGSGYLDNEEYVPSSLTSVRVTNQTLITDKAFYECNNLTSVKYDKDIRRIGDYAFYRCTSLKSYSVPNSVDDIGYYAFRKCTNLTSIYIPSADVGVDKTAFKTSTSTKVYGVAGTSTEKAATYCSQPFKAYVSKVAFTKSKIKIKKKKSYTVKLKASRPGKLKNKHFTWKSSKKSVATVNSSGKIKAKKKGKCYVYAISKDGRNKKAKILVKVK